MLRRWGSPLLVSALTCALVVTPSADATASTKAEKDAKNIEKIRAGIAKLGTGREARVMVRLKNKSKISGFVSEAGSESFVVTDLKTGAATTVAYPEVTQVQGNNLSKGAKIAIAVGIVAGVIIVLVIVRGAFCDGC